jgi:hypothetical protein
MPKLIPRASGSEAAVAEYLALKEKATAINGALYAASRRAALALHDDGLTLSAIGDTLGVTRARAHQLLQSVAAAPVDAEGGAS